MKNKSNEESSTASLSILPDDQRQQVLSYLTCSELLTLTLVSKAVRCIALRSHTLVINDNNDISMSLDQSLRKTIVNSNNFKPMSSHPRQRRWTVCSMNDNRNSIHQMMTALSTDHQNNLTTEGDLICRLQQFQSLRVLKVYNLAATAQEFIQIINSSPAASSLTHIEFHKIRLLQNKYPLTLPLQNNNLKRVALSGTIFSTYEPVLKSIVSSKNLESLHLNGCRSITDNDVKDMSRILFDLPRSRLVDLSLHSSSKLTKPTIKSTSLKKLNLSSCPFLRNLTHVICPNLIELDLCHCSLLNDNSLQSLLLSCPSLEMLLLSGCNTLTAVDITSRRMKKVDLNLCRGLISANIDCEELYHLELGFCQKLENLRLQLKKLKNLDLSMLGLKNLFLHASNLSELNLSGCFDLKKESTFLTCPNLHSIDICSSGLEPDFEKEYAHTWKKINVLKGDATLDWRINF